MADVRTATVTLLFTDIEGSTRLLRQLGGRYGELLREHELLLREAFAAHDGEEIDTQGDSFFVAFASAGEAIRAAVAAQRALNDHSWPEGVALRVRMGIHTGRASVHEKRYLGVAVHRAARICAAGHGGQVLLSETVRNLVEDEEDELPGIEFADLGAQRLKDFDRAVRVYQVVAAGLEREFPPLQTADRTPERGTTPFAPDEVHRIAKPRRRWLVSPRLAAIAGAAIVLGAVPLVWLLSGGDSRTSLASVAPNSVAVIDPRRNELVDAVQVGTQPSRIAVGPSGVWVINAVDRTVSRLDPASHAARATPGPRSDAAITAGRDAAWVAAGFTRLPHLRVTVWRIDTQFYDLTPLGTVSVAVSPHPVQTIALGGDFVWTGLGYNLARFDRADGRTPAHIELDFVVSDLAVDAHAIWVAGGGTANEGAGTLARVSPQTTEVTGTVPIGEFASVAVGFGAVWVASGSGDSVTRLDPATLTPMATIRLPLGSFPTDIAVGEGAVWVVNRIAATVSRIDPETNEVVKTIHIGGHPEGIAAGEGHVWVTVQ